jgi:hypothetical protein
LITIGRLVDNKSILKHMAELEAKIDIHWNSRLESYFSETAEKAHCFSWLHKRAEEYFSRTTVFVDLPVIILSVVNGAISVGSESLFGDAKFASVGIGAVALITGILNAVGSYFAWSRRAEAHKQAYLQYAKLYRFLHIELALPRNERMLPGDLLKYVRTEYDRYAETSPLIPPKIIELFKIKFGDNPKYKDIAKPEEANGLSSVVVYKDHTLTTPSESPVNIKLENLIIPSE